LLQIGNKHPFTWKLGNSSITLKISEFIAVEESQKFWAYLDGISQNEIGLLPTEQSQV
jgi:hypothetical protein